MHIKKLSWRTNKVEYLFNKNAQNVYATTSSLIVCI